MKIAKDALIKVLSQFNPWWLEVPIPDLPLWARATFDHLMRIPAALLSVEMDAIRLINPGKFG